MHRQTLGVEYAISIGASSANFKLSIEMFSGSNKTHFRRRMCNTHIGGGSPICKLCSEIFFGSNKTYFRRRICSTHIGGGSPIAITVGNSWLADMLTVTPSLGYDCNNQVQEYPKTSSCTMYIVQLEV